MDIKERELILHRICLGYFIHTFYIDGEDIILKIGTPTLEQVHISDHIYDETFKDAVKKGVYVEEELQCLLDDMMIWLPSDQVQLSELEQNIEKLKIGLFQMHFRANNKIAIRKSLELTQDTVIDLLNRKHALDMYSAEALARFKKNSYLSSCGIIDLEGNKYIDPNSMWDTDTPLIDEVMKVRTKLMCTETILRQIARTEPWRSIWSAGRKSGSLFDIPAISLSLEQQLLLTWSTVYDNVHESMDTPPEEVIEDDDTLDGWFLLQHKKRIKDKEKRLLEPDGDSKAFQAQEVYVMTDTPEDALKVYNLNDAKNKAIVRQRMLALRKSNVIKEQDMPDKQLQLKMLANQAYVENMKRK